MKVTKKQLGPILNQGLDRVLLPGNRDMPEGRHRLHRPRGPIVAHLDITHVTYIPDISDHVTLLDARRSGYRTTDDYRDDWCRTHDAPWTGAPAWEVTFRLMPQKDTIRLLAEQQGRKDAGQYTTTRLGALPDEGEAIDPDTIDKLNSSVCARQNHVLVQVERNAQEFVGTIGERLDRALAEARRQGVNPSSIERLAARKVQELEERAKRAA